MNKLQFANLVGFVTSKLKGDVLDDYDIKELDRLSTAPVTATCDNRPIVAESVVCDLLAAIKSHQKIESIKAYRVLTNAGLKEAKDAVEKYW